MELENIEVQKNDTKEEIDLTDASFFVALITKDQDEKMRQFNCLSSGWNLQ